MVTISIQFQLDDEQPIEKNLSNQFTLKEFKEKVVSIYEDYTQYRYSFICCGKELDLTNEDEFNKYKTLIINGITIFTIKHSRACFLSDTLIQRADQSEISIKDVQLGDTLIAFTSSGEIVTTVVEDIFKHEVDEYLEIQLGQNQVHVTREHPFFIGNGKFCSINKLCISDCVYSLINGNLQSTSITNIKTITAPDTYVYNLRTTQPHTYLANKIAVHNKFGKLFVNLSNSIGLKRIEWSKTAPTWRIARPGICIEGKCINVSCNAKNQLVVMNIGLRKFDFLKEFSRMSRCPECTQFVNPVTCAFNNCEWRWEGTMQKSDDTEPEDVSGDWQLADNAYHRFDENVSGTVGWLVLIIEAKATGT
ncbi:unnamed protein product [Adineta steineri]|uniref:Hint domain-containing protein n=1 Tax=Adineta steineri TaxID=433720 RepID=A0A819SJC8_9BILA|nr:unnamed protein product [Adineta steineri]CAF4063766.1 unnamed protein product [Adineta steineri]